MQLCKHLGEKLKTDLLRCPQRDRTCKFWVVFCHLQEVRLLCLLLLCVCVQRGLETLPAAAEVTKGTPAWRLVGLANSHHTPSHSASPTSQTSHTSRQSSSLPHPIILHRACAPPLPHTRRLVRKREGRLMQLAPLWALLCWWIEVVWWATRMLATVPALLDPWIYKQPK